MRRTTVPPSGCLRARSAAIISGRVDQTAQVIFTPEHRDPKPKPKLKPNPGHNSKETEKQGNTKTKTKQQEEN